MPTQSEVDYYRRKFQGFSKHKVEWAVYISALTGIATAPLDLLKSRAILMQEGRVVHGWTVIRGVPTFQMAYEIIDSGAGVRGLWKGFDTVVTKSLSLGVLRTFLWCKIYNYFNSDARSKYYLFLRNKILAC